MNRSHPAQVRRAEKGWRRGVICGAPPSRRSWYWPARISRLSGRTRARDSRLGLSAATCGRSPASPDSLPIVDLASEMRLLLANLYTAFATGDTADWENGLAPDALVIGTDDVEWWQGKDRVLPVVRAQTAEMHSAGIRLTGGDPAIATSGDSVWAADRPTMHLPDDTEVPLRVTLLATQDDNNAPRPPNASLSRRSQRGSPQPDPCGVVSRLARIFRRPVVDHGCSGGAAALI
jgi:hypothetical protein